MDDRAERIVKIQLSLMTTEPVRQVVVYNEDMSIHEVMDAPPDILELMGDRDKAYFYYTLVDGNLNLDFEAPEQHWAGKNFIEIKD